MDFLFEIKSFYFSILQIHTCYFSDKRTYKKRMLEGRMVTRKNSYIKYVFASIHPLRDTPHGNHRLLSYSFSIAFRGAILPALRPPTQKSFSPGARWRIALTPRAMPLFTIGRNTISKRLNDVSMGPSLDKTNVSTAQENKLYGGTSTLPYCTSTIADADMLQCVFILAQSSWGHDWPDYSPHVTTYPSLWYSSLRSIIASPPFSEDFLRGHFESTCWSIFLSVHFACPYSYIPKNTQRYSDSIFIRWMFFLIL